MSFKTKLKPWRLLPPHKIVADFATDYLGEAGYIVKVATNNPDDDTYYDSTTSVGASFDGVYSKRWVSPRKVTKAAHEDPAGAILGITLQGTAETDIHGNKVVGFNQRWADENNYVGSGVPVQIATEGFFYLSLDNINGVPAPGSGLIADDDGEVLVVDPADTDIIGSGLLIGKCLSTSGTRQGDALIQLHF